VLSTHSVPTMQVEFTSYALFRKDRLSRGLAVNNSIPCQLLESPSNLELLSVRLCLQQPITVCVLYNPAPTITKELLTTSVPSLVTLLFSSWGISILQISIGQLCLVHLLFLMICVFCLQTQSFTNC